jgi:cytidylate kinase
MRLRPIIAIDGPAGAGKSTTARRLAERLGMRFLDTGALYRAVTLKAWRSGLEPSDEAGVVALAEAARIELVFHGDDMRVLLDGDDVSDEIRGPGVTNAVSVVAALPGVRAAMIPRQREFAADGGVVAEGRDIGTVVFPDADLKVYLDADPAVRAARRARERSDDDVQKVRSELVERDRRDSSRKVAPLRAADDAVRIDSTDLSLDEVVDAIARLVRERSA